MFKFFLRQRTDGPNIYVQPDVRTTTFGQGVRITMPSWSLIKGQRPWTPTPTVLGVRK